MLTLCPPVLRKKSPAEPALLLARVGVTYGHPSMIDVNDCDARLPSSGDATDLYLDYLARLSLILGRVMKNIYTCVCPPAGWACAPPYIR